MIRDGRWKLIKWYEDGLVELFELQTDLGERNNVSKQHSEIAQQMLHELRQGRDSVDATMPTLIDLVQSK